MADHQCPALTQPKQIQASLLPANKEECVSLMLKRQMLTAEGAGKQAELTGYLRALAQLSNKPFNKQQMFCVSCIRLEAVHVLDA